MMHTIVGVACGVGLIVRFGLRSFVALSVIGFGYLGLAFEHLSGWSLYTALAIGAVAMMWFARHHAGTAPREPEQGRGA